MFRLTVFILALLFPLPSLFAQKADSLFMSFEHEAISVVHRVSVGETIFMLSRRYHVPPAILADFNALTYQDGLEKGRTVLIPLGDYNYLKSKPAVNSGARPVYYHVSLKDNLYRVSKNAGLQQQVVQAWNNLPDNAITQGQTLLMGWVTTEQKETSGMVVSQNILPAGNFPPSINKDGRKEQIIIIEKADVPDTVKIIPPAEQLYLTQTNNEQNVIEEKGAAVFFTAAGRVNSTKTIYAFHNVAPKGSVIKVYNPGTEKTVFVKVLGPIPGTKQYHNSIIGISSAAKNILGISDDRTWCELKYAGY